MTGQLSRPPEQDCPPDGRHALDFDREHLVRYTMDNPELEREIIGLFLQQLPSIIAMLDAAASPSAWKMATHTLKGSSAAVGAAAIQASAAELESRGFDVDVNERIMAIARLRAQVRKFETVIRGIYPAWP